MVLLGNPNFALGSTPQNCEKRYCFCVTGGGPDKCEVGKALILKGMSFKTHFFIKKSELNAHQNVETVGK